MRGMQMNLAYNLMILIGGLANASESSLYLDQSMQEENSKAVPHLDKVIMSTGESYRKTQIVFEYFKLPPEENYQADLDAIVSSTSPESFTSFLKKLDPSNQFGRFFDRRDNSIQSFRDRDEKKVSEYRVTFDSRNLPPKQALADMRIAIDPGHMGGLDWDQITGKFVRGEMGLYLSEGVLNLITSHLLAEKLRAKGATVLITHDDIGPVTNMKYDELNLQEFGKKELRSRSLSDWFLTLLQSNSDGNLGPAFSSSAAVKKLFSEIMRSDYFAMREDLWARAVKIREFKPDLTLLIHFDADSAVPDPNIRNITRAYVPGAFGPSEFSTSQSRALFLAHMNSDKTWKRSVEVSQMIIESISKNLKVTAPETDLDSTLRVAPGVFARNLAMTRMLTSGPMAFIECLTYGNSAEFARLTNTDGGVLIMGNKQYPYSKRLVDLSDAIEKGIEAYLAR